MRTHSGRPALVLAALLMAAAGLAACTPNGGSAPSPSASTTAPTPTTPSPGTPSPDTETTSPAPSPSAAPLPSGPGQGNAELAIMVKPSETGTPANFTLVCQNGAPAAESQHPSAAAACTALKANPAILSPVPAGKDRVCTQQYGGPQQATVTGIVDGSSVEASFSLRDGCEIAAWNAAKDVLGSSGGAD
ncbi:serine protease inhibitor [Arthrobacter sp. PAMC25564]|uniref:SSI family serine proteinase inhibitor n=1 Tax=Arthrobacter sp. PAMC25564 TaxID=2565366 RepID=UPI0010A221E3|nr:SSI family serine proteinase inhibitor [Arthrobacter sp. PAMC25564]QCB95654.1 serine protease inhibitor [Arthrobacter sp. PAMC25564]